MKISLENVVKATSEYLNKEFSAMGEDKDKRWAAFGMHMVAEYKMATAGTKALKMMDDGTGFIDLDVLDSFVSKYAADLPDKSFATFLGEIKIKANTPAEYLEHLKKYGEN